MGINERRDTQVSVQIAFAGNGDLVGFQDGVVSWRRRQLQGEITVLWMTFPVPNKLHLTQLNVFALTLLSPIIKVITSQH